MRQFIRKKPLRGGTIESSSSEETVPSKTPLDPLELGRYLVQELQLSDSVDTLGRWMAHHLAELINDARTAKTAKARRLAKNQAASLVLKIWEHRAKAPGVNPLDAYREALEGLRLLNSDPFPRLRPAKTPAQALAARLLQNTRRVVGLVLGRSLPPKEDKQLLPDIVIRFLSSEERQIVDGLNELIATSPETDVPAEKASTGNLGPNAKPVVVPIIGEIDMTLKSLEELRVEILKSPTVTAPRAQEKANKKR